ncbi:MAG TPA: hypothetical protein VLJ42_09240 [Solirubrobacteraceae bacterium]|nr:hypothetical protein [Solirubrobacteraceae bacterium]
MRSGAVTSCAQVRLFPGATLLAAALMIAVVSLASVASARAADHITITPGSFATTLSTHQAGAHPDLTTTFSLDTLDASPIGGTPRDLNLELPKGLVGAANATPTCPMGVVSDVNKQCPASSIVGDATVSLFYLALPFPFTYHVLVYNITPYADEPAAFGFFAIYPVRLDTKVRSDGDYGITASGTNLTEGASVIGSTLTLWGVPADHNGPGPLTAVFTNPSFTYGGPGADQRRPFLTNPTECSGVSASSSLAIDSWQNPGLFDTASFDVGQFTGCERLAFAPSLDLRPDSRVAGAPAGLAVDLSVPQNPDPDGLATAHVKDVSAKLPRGMALSAAAADGLGACSDDQIGLHSLDPAACPDSSKVGTVVVSTPLLDDPLTGDVYIGTQQSSDPQSGQMFRLWLQVAGSGVRVKLPGSVKVDPVTGQLTASFSSNPQVPFDDFKLSFFGGSRAVLVNPSTCGTHTTNATISSWAGSTVNSSSSFVIDQNCDQAGKFEPTLSAGLVSARAGDASPFTLTVDKPSGQQDIDGLDVTLPPGLLAKIGSVTKCGDADASAGTCPAASQIGRTTVASGNGLTPIYIPQPGKAPTAVYLTGPYKGAPYGLSIVVPAQAGPYDLGTVVVRAAVLVDTHDAHVTVKSDPLPTILQGIPLDIQKINVTLDRPAFMVSPTACGPMAVSASIGSSAGAVSAVSSPFQLGGCAALPFSPRFSASTVAKTSRANGASLDAKIVIGVHGEANAHSVYVALPKQLPSRLTTIQKACLATTFAANPASCPAESLVGMATSKTEVLADPLSGPAYLVSHGGAAFPDLVIVLQGDGVRFDLVGAINISSKGITSTRFSNAPDAPIDSFELKLPQGPHSILTSNGSLCAKPLVMPTTITAYNDRQVVQQTKIKVSGCPKAKKAKKHKAKHSRAKHKQAGKADIASKRR